MMGDNLDDVPEGPRGFRVRGPVLDRRKPCGNAEAPTRLLEVPAACVNGHLGARQGNSPSPTGIKLHCGLAMRVLDDVQACLDLILEATDDESESGHPAALAA